MVVCQFYQRGNCKYGDNCWNEHVGRGQGGYGGRPQNYNHQGGGDRKINFRNSFGPNQNPFGGLGSGGGSGGGGGGGGAGRQQPGPKGEPTIGEILATVAQEMDIWDHSKMWPFSCFTYAKDLKSFPGMEDHSPEEVRWKAYEAQATNQSDGYKKWISDLTANYDAKRQLLKRPDQQQKNMLIPMLQEIQKSAAQSSSLGGNTPSTGGLFGSQPIGQSRSSSVFGGTSQAGTSVFGGSSTSTMGGQGTSVFGGQAKPSVFGGNPSQSSTSVFGGGQTQPASSVFGTQTTQSTGAVFGSAAGQNQTTSSVFGTPISQTQAGSSVFGAPTSQSQSTGSVFGTPAGQVQTTGTGSVFGGTTSQPPASSSVFATSQSGQNQSVFGGSTAASQGNTAPTTGLFGGQQASQNSGQTFGQSQPFGGGQPSAQPNAATGLFGKPSGDVPGLFGKPTSQTGSVFSSAPSGGSVFGGGSSGSVFGSAGSATASSVVNANIYTPLDKLKAEEKAAYEADAFSLDNLPMNPPPKELCV